MSVCVAAEEARCAGDGRVGGAAGADGAARWETALQAFYRRGGLRASSVRTRYYQRRIASRLAGIVEPRRRVLEIGCGEGDLLASLRPLYGVGLDLNVRAVEQARRRHPELRFMAMRGEDADRLSEKFDYIVLSQTVGEIYDLLTWFRALHTVSHPRTRLVIVHYSRVWQPALKVMEWLGVKRRCLAEHNWLPTAELVHLLGLSGFETVRAFGMTLAPLPVPVVSNFVNRFIGNLPLLGALGLNNVIVARPAVAPAEGKRPSVSVIVPARNEAGNIPALLERLPIMAPQQEVVFVEGGSRDETWDAIETAIRSYAGPMRLVARRQPGAGKADAVRTGFEAATGDVLMILDADLSVPPEELPAFYDVLCSGKGEFVNGSRMVYLMDKRAMRFLNLLGNKFFGAAFTYLLSQRFRDTLCGTKVLLRRDYQRIKANRAYFGEFDPFGDFDLLFGAAKLNLKIVDLPVHYKARTYGETNISRFQHGWMLLRMCLVAASKLRFV